MKIKGLTEQEVKDSRQRYGTNQLSAQEVETFWDKLVDNLKDPMIIILMVALVLVIILAIFGYTQWYEGVGIAVAVGLATLVSTGSEFKNEQTFQKLNEEASKIFVNIFRDHSLKIIPIDDIVVSDKVFLQPGDKIPADGKLIDGKLKVNQAMLTGEPEPVTKISGDVVDKEINLENPYFIYRGTIVEDGEGVMEVKEVGDKTQFGKLAKDLKVEERPGPLRVKLSKLADDIAKFGYIGAFFIAIAFMFKVIYMDHAGNIGIYFSQFGGVVKDIVTALILAVIIIVVAVPEGLPMMIAIVLAQNMRKLLKSNVLVRQLVGIETAGSLNIVFSDKTGTITKGMLEAVEFLVVNKNKKDFVDAYKDVKDIPANIRKLLNISFIENSSCVVNPNAPNESERILGGNSTERALLKFIKADMTDLEIEETERVSQILFNSKRKFSAVMLKRQDGTKLGFVKGAAEKILEKCSYYYDSNGEIQSLSQEIQDVLSEYLEQKAEDGFRIIATGTSQEEIIEDELSNGLALLGFSLIRDELREDSRPAIETLQEAGIHVVMITGDRHGTAKAIAKDVGLLFSDNDIAIQSVDMEKLSDDELKQLLPNLKVVSRCLPNDKTRLVKLAQELDLVVGMTGDGVNDSPALSNADIGFGLGSGTEVAKEASDIIILDDNIHSIANAVHYGRTIYRSIQKFITFQLTVNFSAISIAFLGPFLGFELPLTMIQLLWINLIMDTLAALAFSGEPPLLKHMKEKPKKRDEKLITKQMWSSILINGMFITLISVFFLKSDFVLSLFYRPEISEGLNQTVFLTAFFCMFVFLNNFNKFNVRVEELNLIDHILENKGFLQVVCLIFVVQVLIVYFGGNMFRTTPLYLKEWLIILLFSMLIIPVDLLRKAINSFLNTKN